jgi:hypothetical protein
MNCELQSNVMASGGVFSGRVYASSDYEKSHPGAFYHDLDAMFGFVGLDFWWGIP